MCCLSIMYTYFNANDQLFNPHFHFREYAFKKYNISNLTFITKFILLNVLNTYYNGYFHPKTWISVWTYCNLHYLYKGVHVSGLFFIFFCITSVFVLLLFMLSKHFNAKSFEVSNRFIWYFRTWDLSPLLYGGLYHVYINQRK
jgi:hypothetical protein